MAVVLLATVVIPAAPAYAASGIVYVGGSSSGRFGSYNQADSSDYLKLTAQASTLASGRCIDMWYDWDREGVGHFDARVARSCRAGYLRDSGNTYESTNVYGWNKLGACYGPNDATTSGTCNTLEGNLGDTLPNIPNACTRAWELTSGGSYLYHAGGSSTSCSS
jgi:hypothetical protein